MFRVSSPKAKLPRTVSYPVGTQLLSEAFVHVPQAAEIEVQYGAKLLGYGTTLHEIVSGQLPHPVLAARYWVRRCAPMALSRDDEPRAYWRLDVYPVERRRKHEVRTLLVEKAFAPLGEWLCAERTQTWLASSHRLECIFLPREGELVLREQPPA